MVGLDISANCRPGLIVAPVVSQGTTALPAEPELGTTNSKPIIVICACSGQDTRDISSQTRLVRDLQRHHCLFAHISCIVRIRIERATRSTSTELVNIDDYTKSDQLFVSATDAICLGRSDNSVEASMLYEPV